MYNKILGYSLLVLLVAYFIYHHIIAPKKLEQELLRATKGNNTELSRLLIEKGANVNAKEDSYGGDTPLLYAIKNKNTELSLLLIEKGADIHSMNMLGDTPISLAFKFDYRHDNTAVRILMIEKGADINAKNSNGQTLLFDASKNNNVEVSILLIEKGADIDAKDNYGRTPLL